MHKCLSHHALENCSSACRLPQVEKVTAVSFNVCRWLGFELSVDQPYRYLLNCANAAGCSSATVAAALCLANDSLMYTSMSAERQPVEVAAGAFISVGYWLDATPIAPDTFDVLAWLSSTYRT